MTTHTTVELTTGEAVQVEVSPPSALQGLELKAKAPEQLETVYGQPGNLEEKHIHWLEIFLIYWTDLSQKAVWSITSESMDELVSTITNTPVGNQSQSSHKVDKDLGTDDIFENLDLDDDGSLDPGDMR